MELETAKKLIKRYTANHSDVIKKIETAERYYRKDNDIKYVEKETDGAENPLRTADNRIPSNFYKLLVNQKAAYAFTEKVTFDTGNDKMNNLITQTLGDSFRKKCKSLCVQAANASIGWLHYWTGDDGKFHYAVMDSKQIIPVWTRDLEKELYAVLRTYTRIDEADGHTYIIYEIWTADKCESFCRRYGSSS